MSIAWTPQVSPDRRRVLVVDDQPTVRDALRMTLEDDYDVIEAGSAAETVAIVGAQAVDLVLLDVLLPDGDGLELLQQLRVIRQGIPVVIVSAVKVLRTAVDAMRLGARDYVTKPYEEEELRATVRRALDDGPGRRALSRMVPPGARRLVVLGDLGLGAVLAITLRDQCRVDFQPLDGTAMDTLAGANPTAVVVAVGPDQAAHVSTALRGVLGRCPILVRPHDGRPWVGPGRVPPTIQHQFLRELMAALRLGSAVRGGIAGLPAAVMSVLDYVSIHYAERLRLPVIAELSGASPRPLLRTFQRATGLTVKQFVTRVRVVVTQYYLARTAEPLDALAEHVGFADASHLSRVVLQHTGRRPGAYRPPPS